MADDPEKEWYANYHKEYFRRLGKSFTDLDHQRVSDEMALEPEWQAPTSDTKASQLPPELQNTYKAAVDEATYSKNIKTGAKTKYSDEQIAQRMKGITKAADFHISQHVLGNTGKVEESNLPLSENLTPMAKKPKKPMVNEDGVPVMSAQQMIDLLPPEEVAKRQRQDARTDKKLAGITPAQLAQEKKRRLNPSSADYEKILSDVREAGGSYTIGSNKYYPEGTSYQGTTSTKDVDMASKKGKKSKASGAGKNMTPAVEAVVNRVEDATPEATTDDAPAKTKSSRTRTPAQQAARTQRERAKRETSKEKTDESSAPSDAVTSEIAETPSTPASKPNMFGTYAEQKAANPVAPLETTPTRRDPSSSETPPSTMPKSIFGTVAEQQAGTAPKPELAIKPPRTNVSIYGPGPEEGAYEAPSPQLFDHEKETVNDGEQSTVLPPRLRERISHFGTGAKNWAQAMVKPSAPQQALQPPAASASPQASPQTLQPPTASAPQASAPASPYSAQPSTSGVDNSVNKGAYSAGPMSASNVNTGNSGRIGDENTHTQKISGGYGPVTATTSGRATSSGKGGVTASTSGNATSGHPRAQNASRGSRPTNKG